MSRGTTWNRTKALATGTVGALLHRDRWLCAYCGCGVTRSTLTLDHVVPRAHGGSNAPSNLVVACSDCNVTRGVGPIPSTARAEVARRIALPLDKSEGQRIGDALYPWSAQRRAVQAEAQRRLRAARKRLGEGLGGDAFPFGANAEEGCAA